jgi:predicted metal-dependent peptidase
VVTTSPASEPARLRVMAARIIAQMRWPYISSVLFNLRLVETDGSQVPTMAVDAGWRLYYSTDFVLSEDPESLATVLIHEAMHCLMTHNERLASYPEDDRRPHLWNICGDCAINQILDDAEMPWTESVTPVRYSNFEDVGIDKTMITETAYAIMLAWTKENKSEADDRFQIRNCGSVAGGSPREYELVASHEVFPAMGSEQQMSSRDRVAVAILKRGNEAGSVPSGLLRWAEAHLDPQVDWKKQLGVSLRRAVADIAGRKDYSYMRPSRRQHALNQAGSNVLLPSLRQPAPPKVSVVVDTSGSISEDELRRFVSEVSGIVRAVGFSSGVNVICCDAAAYPAQTFKNPNKLDELELLGGGGTDMREGISAAIGARQKPDLVVVVTDGYTPWPDSKPRQCGHFITVLTSAEELENVPDWMKTIVID